ncbi:transposase family protein [Micromonospora sp. NPDC023814]|uniref:transposase family protein n=1 Tax=Micromonospora sp. NPDC023814 TaxID=3154596 RepID=UPI0033F1C80A
MSAGLRRVLTTAVAAVLGGARSAAAVAEWANDAPQQVLAGLGAWRNPFTGVYRAPDEPTFRRILAGVDATLPAPCLCRCLRPVDGEAPRRC